MLEWRLVDNLLVLAPVLTLFLGALATAASARLPRIQLWIPIATLAVASLSVINASRLPTTTLTLFSYSSAGANLDLSLTATSSSLLFSLILLVGGLSIAAGTFIVPQARLGSRALFVLATGILFFSANNWTAIVAAWIVVDVALLIWRLSGSTIPQPRGMAWWSFGLGLLGSLLFLGAGVLQAAQGASLQLSETTIQSLPLALVLVACWIRSGLYPFHFPDSHNLSRFSARGLPDLAVTLLLGLFLLVRVVMVADGDYAFKDQLQLLALIGVAATATLAASEGRADRQMKWTALALGSLLFVNVPASPAARAGYIVWLGLGLFNVLILVALGGQFDLRAGLGRWSMLFFAAAIACTIGIPLTPSFLGRVGYYYAFFQDGSYVVVAFIVLMTTLACAPLLRKTLVSPSEEPRRPNVFEYFGIGLAIVPLLLEAVLPFRLNAVFGRAVEDGGVIAYDALLHPVSILQPTVLIAAILLPLPLAYLLAQYEHVWRSRADNVPNSVGSILDLSPFARAGMQILDAIGVLLRTLGAIVEQYPIGWILFAAIWVALWLIQVR